MEWISVPREEQETIINIDYGKRTLNFYTSRKTIANRLEKKIGMADKVEMIGGKVYAASYKRDLTDKSINVFLSKTIICASFSHINSQDDSLY